MNTKRKKASMELSVNFLVVMIICIVLLGIGIKLITTFVGGAEKMRKDVDSVQKAELIKAMNDGALVAVYPIKLTVNRGSNADFSLGIANELGRNESFSLYVLKVSSNSGIPPTPLYVTKAIPINNNEQYFTPIRIPVPKEASHGTYIFNVYVCHSLARCINGSDDSYGDLQKLYVNVN